MNAIEVIRLSLQFAQKVTLDSVGDMREDALRFATPGAKGGHGNHVVWTLGHLCVVEAWLPSILFGEPSALASWEKLFGIGSECRGDGAGYPSFDELVAKYTALRASTLKLLDGLGEAGLGRVPAQVPPGFESEMKTFGHTIQLVALHNLMHIGQVTDMRRQAGKARRI